MSLKRHLDKKILRVGLLYVLLVLDYWSVDHRGSSGYLRLHQ